MIAASVGIDISTLYYHWGEKGDLYEAVIIDMKVLTLMNAIHNYVSGEAFFLPMLLITREEYIRRTKETILFFALSNFVEPKEGSLS